MSPSPRSPRLYAGPEALGRTEKQAAPPVPEGLRRACRPAGRRLRRLPELRAADQHAQRPPAARAGGAGPRRHAAGALVPDRRGALPPGRPPLRPRDGRLGILVLDHLAAQRPAPRRHLRPELRRELRHPGHRLRLAARHALRGGPRPVPEHGPRALARALPGADGGPPWPGWYCPPHFNWNAVCAGGAGLLALAMYDELPEARRVLPRVEKSIDVFMRGLQQTGGGWIEGVGYWDYGMRYAFLYLLSHERATGRSHPLIDLPETKITLGFPTDFSPNGVPCGFGDSNLWRPMPSTTPPRGAWAARTCCACWRTACRPTARRTAAGRTRPCGCSCIRATARRPSRPSATSRSSTTRWTGASWPTACRRRASTSPCAAAPRRSTTATSTCSATTASSAMRRS